MVTCTFRSGGQSLNLSVSGAPAGGGKVPVIVLIHGNFGLGPPYGAQIEGFAEALSRLGYMTAVPHYYADDAPHPDDVVPHVQTIADAVAAVLARPGADRERVGLIGFSLGAATAMAYIAAQPPGTVKVLADFFGFLTDDVRSKLAAFPPTIVLHNVNDRIVPVSQSRELDRLLASRVEHRSVEYDEQSPPFHHAFEPGGKADVASRAEVTKWFVAHLPPTAK